MKASQTQTLGVQTRDLHDKYTKYIKTRLNIIRFSGLIMSILGLLMVAIQHFELINSIWNAISILYICGFLFTLFAQYQDLRMKKRLSVCARVMATIFYIATLGLLVLILLESFTTIINF